MNPSFERRCGPVLLASPGSRRSLVCTRPGSPGRLPAPGPHRAVRARLTHTVPQAAVFATWYTEWTTRAAGSGYRANNRAQAAHLRRRPPRRFSHFNQIRCTVW